MAQLAMELNGPFSWLDSAHILTLGGVNVNNQIMCNCLYYDDML